jgi:hypothetical protein
MEALARRRTGRVAAYQVFDEPNLTYEWGEDAAAAAAAAYARECAHPMCTSLHVPAPGSG